ncbi:MAG: response regulator [Lachnospiraceae bacterium]|nr:response regulator [Lachnospiraceae bacterium]
MNDSFYIGRVSSHFLYCASAVLVILVGFAQGNVPVGIHTCISVFLIASIVVISRMWKNYVIGAFEYKRILMSLGIVLTLIVCYEFNNPHLLFYILFVQCFSALLFSDKSLCIFQLAIMIVLLLVLGVLHYGNLVDMSWLLGEPGELALSEYGAGFLNILIVQWMMITQVQHISFQRRQNSEQERSLDDMLKVVEVKCGEARQAAKSKSDFLSNMSHEIRTPINAVLGMNEMILRESTEDNVKEYAVNVESSGRMLLSLINDILDFSKIESGKMEIVPVEYQLSSVLNDLINMVQPKAVQKGLKLNVEVDGDIPNYLYGDEVRIRQVVTNLLSNAVKYTDSGTVTLKVNFWRRTDDEIQLCFDICDTGRGIKPEDQEKLFQSFRRVDQQNNRNIEGTGLGLAITKSFVDMMWGTLKVSSVYGEGSTFTATIPQKVVRTEAIGDFKKQVEQSVQARDSYKESFKAPDAKILVVDDNGMNLTVVKGLLKLTDVQIDTAMSGMECLQKLREKEYHILLLDHMMPKMDGVETLKCIREEGLAKDIPVIALTANAVSGAREMYMDYGFQDYLSKPIVGKALEKALIHWLPQELLTLTEKEDEEISEETENAIMAESETVVGGHVEQNDVETIPSELDKETAMMYCCNSEEMYRELLNSYYRQREKWITSLTAYVEQEDWENYRILVHSMKSNSMTIGAKNFSEEARKHEFAVKEGNYELPKQEWKKLLTHYKQVILQVQDILE